MDNKDFEALIKKDRDMHQSRSWRGNLLGYLEKVKADPTIAKLSHARTYDTIMKRGVRDIHENSDPHVKRLYKDESIKLFDFFSDEFFGIEKTVSQIVRYFHAASLKGEESRQVLYLMGPVGSGKSSLVEKLHRGLEESEPFYAIEGCPMFEEPLHLIPRHLRKEFEKMLGVHVEGDLCPVCRFKLIHEYAGKYEEFPVCTVEFSKRSRIGIGVVPPVDPNNQDTSVLIGSEDISKLDLYSEGDPRVLELNGAFNIGNRGIVEFIEVFKNEIEYLHCMITATQEKVVPAPGRHGLVYVDTVIVAHSNEAEWQKFKADHTNEAILDRIVVVRVPYNLRLSEEVKIYQKIIRNSDFRAHVAPHTLEIASMFAILSRLSRPTSAILMTKLKLYNGEEVVEKGRTKKVDVQELRDGTKREGMNGISTRFIMKALDNALSDNHGRQLHQSDQRARSLDQHGQGSGHAGRYTEAVSRVPAGHAAQGISRNPRKGDHPRLCLFLPGTSRSAVPELSRSRRGLCQQEQGQRPQHERRAAPDEGFMKSIEEQIAIIGSAADGFRQEVIAYLWAANRRGEKIDYRSYEPLKEAIEKKLITSVRDLSRVITKARMRDEEQSEKYNAMVKNLLDHGYCQSCVDMVLKYAANNLWKD